MASGWYLTGLVECLDGTIDLDTDTIKVMLVGTSATTYVYDPDHTVIDNGGNDATDPSFCELVATDYTPGFAGAGRKTASITIQAVTTNDRVEVVITDITWTGLGGGTNDTVTHALLIKENADDTDSRLIACWDITNTTTNNTDFTLDFSVEGNIQIPNN